MEKIKQIYIDSSIFILAALRTDEIGRKARKIINSIKIGNLSGSTSTLTFDEITYVIRKEIGFDNSLIIGGAFLSIPHLKFLNVDYKIILNAQDIIKKYKLKPRDAIHASCAILEKIRIILSEDDDFDVIKEIERKGVIDFKIKCKSRDWR